MNLYGLRQKTKSQHGLKDYYGEKKHSFYTKGIGRAGGKFIRKGVSELSRYVDLQDILTHKLIGSP